MSATQRIEEYVRKGRTGGNSATVTGAGDAGCLELGRAGDAIPGGAGKGVAAGEAA